MCYNYICFTDEETELSNEPKITQSEVKPDSITEIWL